MVLRLLRPHASVSARWRSASAISVVGLLLGSAQANAHPSLYFDAAALETLQSRAADTSVTALGYSFADAFDALRDEADGYLTAPYSYSVSIPDPDGQGSATWSYTLSASMPPPHPNNPSYPPWTAVSRGIQSRMQTLAFAYAMTGNGDYLRSAQGTGAIDMALAVAAWSQWTDPGYGCGGQSCLDTAHLTMGVAMVYDVGYSELSDAERTTLRAAIVDEGIGRLEADVLAGGMSAWPNGYALRVAGLGVGAAAVSEELGSGADGWLGLAHDSVLGFFASQGADGGSYEGQLYGSYAVDSLMIAAHCLLVKGMGDDIYADPWLATVPRFAASFLGTGNRQLANFGDSSLAAYWASTMFALAGAGDATAQWYLSLTGNAKPRGFLSFVQARPDLAGEPIADSGTSLFHDVGHAVLRAGFDGAPVVAVKSGPPSEEVGHNHLDHNSFIVSAHGEWIASDPGYESYFNAAEREYTTGSIGHNTLLVDKTVSADGATVTGDQATRTGGSLEYLFDGAGYAKVVAHAGSTYAPGTLTRFDRRVFLAKPDLVLVFDDVGSSSSHEYSFLLHTGRGNGVEPGDGPGEMRLVGHSARLQAFTVANAPLASSYPRRMDHPGASSYGPYAEWRTQSAASVQLAMALVPGHQSHVALDNPGFEAGLASWTPRFDDATHAADSGVAHSGAQSARIAFTAANTGYYYSEPLTVAPGATITASVFAQSSGASGTLSVTPYYMKDGDYIAEPAGESSSLAAASASSWTELALSTTAPASGVDAVRIALGFTGTGTVWFDDADCEIGGAEPPTPWSTAVPLGSPAVGLVVEGPFGVEAAASLVGSGLSGLLTFEPDGAVLGGVTSVSSDGAMFAAGLDGAGQLVRAYLQGGTTLSVGAQTILRASDVASFDVGLTRDADGCVSLRATEVATLEAPPYTVGALADEVWLGGVRVPFTVAADSVTFPDGDELGPGCESGSGGAGGTGGAGGGVAAGGSAGSGAGAAGVIPGSGSDDDGCGCRLAFGQDRTAALFALVMLGLAAATRRWRRQQAGFR